VPPTPPRRATATVLAALAMFCGTGLGHVYIGRTRRAVAWFFAPLAMFFVLALLARPIGAALGYGTWAALVVLGFVTVWGAAIVDVRRLAPSQPAAASTGRIVVFAIAFFLGGRLTALPVRWLVLEAFKIPGTSMAPTLASGDHIFVSKTHAAARGDVIVFAFPEHPSQDFVKRVLAVPGDVLETRNGRPWINGWEVPTCRVGPYSYLDDETMRHDGELVVEYLGPHAYLTFYETSVAAPSTHGPFTAREGEVWVVGDNRDNSHDSRWWYGGQGGGVPYGLVRGRALFVWLAFEPLGGIDYSRIGADLDVPTLPRGARVLAPALEACLRARPPADRTSPPRR
jgi:signal peptidase I